MYIELKDSSIEGSWKCTRETKWSIQL